jgi:hypothetical protein
MKRLLALVLCLLLCVNLAHGKVWPPETDEDTAAAATATAAVADSVSASGHKGYVHKQHNYLGALWSDLVALSEGWWQWVASIPIGVNPILDETGKHCMVGQHGKTWYLGQFFAPPVLGTPVTRRCTVPAGRNLMVPVINILYVRGTEADDSPADVLNNVKLVGDKLIPVSATLNGVRLPILRLTSTNIFPIALPTDPAENLFDPQDPNPTPGASDGYWVYIPGRLVRPSKQLTITTKGYSNKANQVAGKAYESTFILTITNSRFYVD